MGTRLHSLETYIYKYLMPIIFTPWDGFRGLSTPFPNSSKMPAVMIVFWALMAPFIFWTAVKLKTVVMDDDVLHVKGYFTEIDIPFADIVSIKRRLLVLPHVTLQLRAATGFGDKILFIAKGRIVTSAGRRSTFEELGARIAGAQA